MPKKYWSVNTGKTWQRANTKTHLLPNEYTVKFSDVPGLLKPNDIKTIIEANQHVVINANYYSYDQVPLKFTALQNNTSVALNTNGTSSLPIYYKLNDNDWASYTIGQSISLSENESVRFKNESNTFSTDGNNCFQFSGSGNLKVSGFLTSLLNYSESMSNFCFGNLFKNLTCLTDASELILPTTTLATNCYYSMFSGCTSLISAPALPATTLANNCYRSMFSGCKSLTTAPALPATTLAGSCYQQMFSGCTALQTVPALPATTLANYCYSSMFNECAKLITAPQLPATTLAYNCYSSMFYGCNKLTTAPALPATTLANNCYSSMFYLCEKLTTAPVLPATTLTEYCYHQMFRACKSLTTAPALPATTLANYCYQSMFQGCTSLTTAPVLPATTLVNGCYYYMFYGCTKLNYIEVNFEQWLNGATTNWLYNVSSTGTFVKPAELPETSGSGYIPSGWTIMNIGDINPINIDGLDDTVSFNLDMIIEGINDDEIVIQLPEGGSYDYDTLVAIGFSGGDLTYPVNGSYDCSVLNGTWNRITTTDDATLQTNGFKTEQWQHADHGFILKYSNESNMWIIVNDDTNIASEAGAGANQLTPWDEIYTDGNLATMWAGLMALPLNGKFYLKSTTQQEGFGAKYLISGCPIDDYNGYYKLSDETSYNNNPVYVNTKESDNPTKMIIMDEALVPRIQLGTGDYSGLWGGQYQYGEYGGYDIIQSDAEMWQSLTGTAISGMKCTIL